MNREEVIEQMVAKYRETLEKENHEELLGELYVHDARKDGTPESVLDEIRKDVIDSCVEDYQEDLEAKDDKEAEVEAAAEDEAGMLYSELCGDDIPVILDKDSMFDPMSQDGDLYEDARCDRCKKALPDDGYYDETAECCYCETCADVVLIEMLVAAKAEAAERCRITQLLPRYYESLEYRCTPEEYENGDKYSYSPNAYACECRHSCTNYDDLLPGNNSGYSRVLYYAIRERIHELLLNADEGQYEPEVEAA